MITVNQRSGYYEVVVKDQNSSMIYEVTLEDELCRKLGGDSLSKEECIRRSFLFLLDHEPKESILSNFDVSVISRYFPNFERDFEKYT